MCPMPNAVMDRGDAGKQILLNELNVILLHFHKDNNSYVSWNII